MRRTAALLLIVILGVVTAMTLVRAAAAITAPGVTGEAARANKALIGRYYDAVNHAILTGDLTLLETVVALDVIVHRAVPDAEPQPAGFAHAVAALHTTEPNLRIEVEELIVDRDRVVTRVAFHGITPGALIAVPVPGITTWGTIDTFRIADGKVVEQWGATANLNAPSAIAQAAVELQPMSSAFVGVTRLTIDPGAGIPVLVGPGPAVLALEAGTLTVRLDGGAVIQRAAPSGTPRPEETIGSGTNTMLHAGDHLLIRAGVSYTLQNDGEATAALLVAAIFPAAAFVPPTFSSAGLTPAIPPSVALFVPDEADDMWPSVWPAGVTTQVLAGSVTASVPAGPARLSLERMVLAPGTSVALPPTVLALLAVEAGEGLLATTRGMARVHPIEAVPPSEPAESLVSPTSGPRVLTPGSSGIVESGAEAFLRNPSDGAVHVLIVAID